MDWIWPSTCPTWRVTKHAMVWSCGFFPLPLTDLSMLWWKTECFQLVWRVLTLTFQLLFFCHHVRQYCVSLTLLMRHWWQQHCLHPLSHCCLKEGDPWCQCLNTQIFLILQMSRLILILSWTLRIEGYKLWCQPWAGLSLENALYVTMTSLQAWPCIGILGVSTQMTGCTLAMTVCIPSTIWENWAVIALIIIEWGQSHASTASTIPQQRSRCDNMFTHTPQVWSVLHVAKGLPL